MRGCSYFILYIYTIDLYKYNDKAILQSTEDERSCTESKRVAMQQHYFAHSFCCARSAFTYHRDHYSLLVYQEHEVEH